jgi:hypothetical protein
VAVAWRLAVVAALGTFVVVEARLLGDDPADLSPDSLILRRRLLPLTATLAMVGILAGMTPGRPRARARGMAWLSVVWAGSAGVLIAVSQAFVPYLVLLALEAVSNAMSRPDRSQLARLGLHRRVIQAGLESIPVLACCFLLGLLISHELRRPASRPGGRGASWRGPLALLVATAATAAGAAWLVAVTIPRLHESLAEGLSMTVGLPEAAALVLGIAGLAIGPVTRAADRPGRPEPGAIVDRPRTPFLRVLLLMAVASLLLDFLLAGGLNLSWLVEWSWTRWVERVNASFRWLLVYLPSPLNQVWYLLLTPQWVALALAQAWVCWRVACLLVSPFGSEPTPIDASLEDRHALARCATRWLALTVLMLAALPVLFVVGLVAMHGLCRFL